MSLDTILLFFGMIVGFSIVGFLLSRRTRSTSSDDQRMLIEWLKTMQLTLDRTNTTLAETLRGTSSETHKVLAENTKQLNERLDSAAHVIGELKRNMGELSEVGRGIKDLQSFLQSPKLRGGLGEEVLADMIAQLFPKQSFMLQYAFKSGAKVDAAIKTDGGILPIDAKFPMSHFLLMNTAETEGDRVKAKKEFIQDVKKHILDISKKYILPTEGTLDFALMYIPSEAVYYEIVMTQELMNTAKRERIYPVSPNTLYAHLQVLLVSFQGKDIEKKTHEVMQMLRSIVHEYEKLQDQYAVLGKHITNAYNTHVSVSTGLNQLGQKIDQTKLLGEGR